MKGNAASRWCASDSQPGLDAVFYAGNGLGVPQPAWYPAVRMEAHWAHCLLRRPDDLSCHIRRINYWLDHPGVPELAAALLDLFVVFGGRKGQLRERLLAMAGDRLPPALRAYLAAPQGPPPLPLPSSLFANHTTYPGGPRLEHRPASDSGTSMSAYPLIATPAGAYFAVSSAAEDPLREALLQLLAHPLPWPARGAVRRAPDAALAPEVVSQLMTQEWTTRTCLDKDIAWEGPLEPRLAELLPALSDSGCALVADQQGLRIASAGFDDREADELAALSAEAIALGVRHRRLLARGQLEFSAAWAMVDAAGNSQVGVWPIFIGDMRFALVVAGRPLFSDDTFVRLIRTLVRRVVGHPL